MKDKVLKRKAVIAIFCAFWLAQNITAAAQTRLKDENTIAWLASMNTIHVSSSVSVWVEAQVRREQFVTNWQQLLLRTGLQYHFKSGVSAMVGYGYITTYPYGEWSAGPYTVPEHRIFEQLIWNDAIGRLQLNHRLRQEQRFGGKVDQKAAQYEVTDWTYTNRTRYQLRMTIPLNHDKMIDRTWHIVGFDEVFIGFGKNVNQNIFDQNRAGVMVGYQYNKVFRVEAGFINQTVHQSSMVLGKQVYQYNNGAIMNVYLTRPAGKKKGAAQPPQLQSEK